MKKIAAIFLMLVASHTWGQQPPLSVQMANTALRLWPDSFLLTGDKVAKWRYDQGVILQGIEAVWNATGDGKWFQYIQKSMDFYTREDGTIKGYRADEYTLDNINNGKLLLLLYQVTGKEKYKKAVDLLRDQLKTQPRTSEGGFWHKKIYPHQMWLDGLYMAEPFYAAYASLFHGDTSFNDITQQFEVVATHTRDPKTGLLYHGWDESRQEQWANQQTGQSPNFWSRAMGWYGMALVDALDYYPVDNPGRKKLINLLDEFVEAILKKQDPKTGLWYDITDKGGLEKNYLEASGSCMMVYTLAKAVREKYLPLSYFTFAQKGYTSIVDHFIETTSDGQVNLKGTVSVSGLGGKPYRDGSFDYYMGEPVVTNDPKGIGAFIQCAAEMEKAATQGLGGGRIVLLDNFYNNEWKKDATGVSVPYHYTWEDKANSGYSMLGQIFNRYGVETRTLTAAPSLGNLKQAAIYVIVDPDTEKETEKPNYMDASHAALIADWVSKGGVLVLLSNDAGNAEFTHFNQLPELFGIHFNEDSKNKVLNDQFEQGVVMTSGTDSIFGTPKKLYIKELSSLQVKPPAAVVTSKGQDNIIAVAHYGKGTVFALGDPWIYDEYLDGRKLPASFDNFKAADQWVRWLIKQSSNKRWLGRSK